MKQNTIRRMISAVMTLTLLLACSIPALAEGDKGVGVILDGQAVTFTDASPRVENGRTMLPFRAIFEAMGATVDYDTETSTVVATLNGKTLNMPIGSTEATITENGVTTTLYMDIAPYVDAEQNRTYVPVRFAAEAFGCNVGWDQDSQTVIIVDVEKLVSEILSGYEFTILQQYLDYTASVNSKNLETNGVLNMTATLLGQSIFTADSTFSGVNEGQTSAQMLMNFTMDMTGLLNLLGADATEELSTLSMTMDMRMDLEAETFYFLFDDTTNTSLGLPAGTWLSMTMDDLTGESVTGVDADIEWSTLASTEQSYDLDTLLTSIASAIPLDGQTTTAYEELSATISSIAQLLSDEGFSETEDGYQTVVSFDLEGNSGISILLTVDSEGAVNGYKISCDLAISTDFISDYVAAEDLAALDVFGGLPETITVTLSATQSEVESSTMELTIALGTLASFTMDLDATYAPATTAPETTLPEGAAVVPFSSLLSLVSEG